MVRPAPCIYFLNHPHRGPTRQVGCPLFQTLAEVLGDSPKCVHKPRFIPHPVTVSHDLFLITSSTPHACNTPGMTEDICFLGTIQNAQTNKEAPLCCVTRVPISLGCKPYRGGGQGKPFTFQILFLGQKSQPASSSVRHGLRRVLGINKRSKSWALGLSSQMGCPFKPEFTYENTHACLDHLNPAIPRD